MSSEKLSEQLEQMHGNKDLVTWKRHDIKSGQSIIEAVRELEAENERLKGELEKIYKNTVITARQLESAFDELRECRRERDEARADAEQWENRFNQAWPTCDQHEAERDAALSKLERVREWAKGKRCVYACGTCRCSECDKLDPILDAVPDSAENVKLEREALEVLHKNQWELNDDTERDYDVVEREVVLADVGSGLRAYDSHWIHKKAGYWSGVPESTVIASATVTFKVKKPVQRCNECGQEMCK